MEDWEEKKENQEGNKEDWDEKKDNQEKIRGFGGKTE